MSECTYVTFSTTAVASLNDLQIKEIMCPLLRHDGGKVVYVFDSHAAHIVLMLHS